MPQNLLNIASWVLEVILILLLLINQYKSERLQYKKSTTDIHDEQLKDSVEYVPVQKTEVIRNKYKDTTSKNNFIIMEFKATADDEMEFKIILSYKN